MKIRKLNINKVQQSLQQRWESRANFTRPIHVIGILFLMSLFISFSAGVWFHRTGDVGNSIDWARKFTSENIRRITASDTTLSVITMDMNFKNLTKIKLKRAEAIDIGFLFASNADFVSAKLTLDGQTVPVRTRLKGDFIDHLQGDKWSFRIEVKGDEHLLGMSRFSIQHPATREYVLEWGFFENLRREGILAPRYDFVELVFNGENRGYFALEEHFSKEMLESQGRREGVIIRFDEDNFWRQVDLNGKFTTFRFGPQSSVLDAFGDTRIANSESLTDQRNAAIGLLRGYLENDLDAASVFDVELLGKFFAVTELWAAEHGLAWHNLRFYFNPITARLEPIGFDAEPKIGQDPLSLLSRNRNGLALDLANDPAVSSEYVRAMQRISETAYLTDLRQDIGDKYEELTRTLSKEFGELPLPWQGLAKRQAIMKNALDPLLTVLAYQFKGTGTADDGNAGNVKIEVRNLLIFPVKVYGFAIGENEFIPATEALSEIDSNLGIVRDGNSVVIPRKENDRMENRDDWVRFEIPNNISGAGNYLSGLRIVSSINGLDRQRQFLVNEYVYGAESGLIPSAPTIEEAMKNHEFLVISSTTDVLMVKSGDWEVIGDLILPIEVPLLIGPGTSLRFDENAILLARAPLLIRGELESPVHLGPKGASWGGIVVLGVDGKSELSHVLVSGTRGINRNGWQLTGGITYYESPVSLFRCRIFGSQAEDALNIVRSEFNIAECAFEDHRSDAFDGDFVSGQIRDSSFRDIGGDAIDLSGSFVRVENVSVTRIGDKGISAGEASEVEVFDYQSVSSGIAIASKDLSNVRGTGIKIVDTVNVGLAVYNKKSEYGPANLTLSEVEFVNSDAQTIVQTGSTLLLNGEEVEGIDIDVDALYAAEILGN